jgi:hypothetical protein
MTLPAFLLAESASIPSGTRIASQRPERVSPAEATLQERLVPFGRTRLDLTPVTVDPSVTL